MLYYPVPERSLSLSGIVGAMYKRARRKLWRECSELVRLDGHLRVVIYGKELDDSSICVRLVHSHNCTAR